MPPLLSNYFNLLYLVVAVFAIIIFIVIIFGIFRRILRIAGSREFSFDKDILLIRVPKETPKNVEQELTTQALHEDIAAAESIFSLIGGLKANPNGLVSWLFGVNNTFSFEIVANKKIISFYVVAPKKQRRFIEQEIYARYPFASIEETKDYNIFNSQSEARSTGLMLKRSNMFSIRTYKKMDIDPLDSIINTLAKLGENEGAAIQMIVRSAPKSWRARGTRVMREVRQGKTLSEAMKNTGA
ncbi:hypothetical protein COT95_00300, partial [Candidatus Falkowbacteria bacterium CG10_big_fil_rev_8_21_14_0_10_37_6]